MTRRLSMTTVALVLATVGCGGGVHQPYPGQNERARGWDEDLGRIALDFVADAEERGLPLGRLGGVTVIRSDTEVIEANQEEMLDDEDRTLMGLCLRWWTGKDKRHYRAEIYIREGVVGGEVGNHALERLMYHELTHCVYEQEHFGDPGDIMFPSMGTTVFGWDEARDRHFSMLGSMLTRGGK